MQVLWFKRDLRCHDHAALWRALQSGPVLPLYVFEPELIHAPDHAAQHLGFVQESLAELRETLSRGGLTLQLRTGRMPDVLAELHPVQPIEALHSHEETGNALTYARDLRVAAWCRAHGVPWHEAHQTAVIRRLKDRDTWAGRWLERMAPEPLPVPWRAGLASVGVQSIHSAFEDAPSSIEACLSHVSLSTVDKAQRQRGGRSAGVALLSSFLTDRAWNYRKGMSSPLSAHSVCSRLSPHLAFGTLSIREVVHSVWRRRDALMAQPPSAAQAQYLQALKSFESRLHWHCHFMQKLESQPDIEHRSLLHATEGLRPDPLNEPLHAAKHAAWCAGQTGVPMVDACMRMLNATGWVNFRMRAMLVAFSSYHLWHHWRGAAQHLAQAFLDYEPGIHYPQIQMQSGATGINLPRIYNPIKQARDQDPQGIFVRRWCPELARLPLEHVFEPWAAPIEVQREAGCIVDRDYPSPIVDLQAAARHAREQIWATRQGAAAKREVQAIYVKHGSRNPNREGRKPKKLKLTPAKAVQMAADPQASLF